MATSKRTDYSVPLCRSDARRDFTVSFHRIHKDKNVRRQSKIRRDHGKSFTITTNTVVCSIHFMKDDFKWTGSHPLGDTLAIEMMLFKSLRKCHHLRNLQQGAHQSPSLIHAAECDATITNHQSYIDQLNEKLREQGRQLKEKDDKTEELNRRLELEKFGVCKFMYDDILLEYYTGLPSFQTLQDFFDFIKPTLPR
ncbi:uncharacterized protein LOC124149032 isoform X2 [Haliotis rufescens]|uniref:uncharacterized protein LOC124149032 isoform X2 n=1 Tax=Haliotis rufescens TaxID=6454 RepID=UPI00201E79C2|nr:uncharacterized protein LOC124149032 isoform X2 [Haliotis rufescens]